MGAKILVVDDDPWMPRIVMAALSKQPFAIEVIADATVALAKATVRPPDLVISDVVMPGMDGWGFVRRLRASPRLALVPFIFITGTASPEAMLRGFQLGADDFLTKPFRPEELEARVLGVLRRSRALAADARRSTRSAGMHGRLSEIGPSSLLTLLEMDRKTGLLKVSRAGGEEAARLFLRDGRVISAAADQGPPLAGADVVYWLLDWGDGEFEFSSLPIEMADTIGTSIAHLILEAARRRDEAALPGGPPARRA